MTPEIKLILEVVGASIVLAFFALLAVWVFRIKPVVPKECWNCDLVGDVYRSILCDKCGKDKSQWRARRAKR
jgi:hypothetical protein